ncbi:hypothetical protein NIES298_46840 [Microcystis aeruginosa NIES-298]|nr:hypothetical protein NIES298_46840 [Microcystis aeruginosa NIES-298]
MTVHAVIGSEVQGIAHRRHLGEQGNGPKGTGADILDQNRTGRRAVALPQFLTVHVVIGSEVQGTAHCRQTVGGADVGHRNCTGYRAVALP